MSGGGGVLFVCIALTEGAKTTRDYEPDAVLGYGNKSAERTSDAACIHCA